MYGLVSRYILNKWFLFIAFDFPSLEYYTVHRDQVVHFSPKIIVQVETEIHQAFFDLSIGRQMIVWDANLVICMNRQKCCPPAETEASLGE